MRIGEYLTTRSLITEDELQVALAEQQACLTHCFLGDILVGKEILSKEDFEQCLEEFLIFKGETLECSEIHLGELLVSSNIMTKIQLNECLQLQQQSDDQPLLGEVLINQGYLTTDDLVTFLSNQRVLKVAGETSEK